MSDPLFLFGLGVGLILGVFLTIVVNGLLTRWTETLPPSPQEVAPDWKERNG